MPIGYVIRRLIRSWQLYAALLLGVILASTFFAGINVGADSAAKQALDQQLARVLVDFYISSYNPLSYRNISSIINGISTVPDVEHAEAISRTYAQVQIPNHDQSFFRIVGISNESQIYEGWSNPPSSIKENETYVWAASPDAGSFKQGDTIQVNMTMNFIRYPFENTTFPNLAFNLTVAGFAQLNDRASALVQGQYYASVISGSPFGGQIIYQPPKYVENLLIVDLKSTMNRILDTMNEAQQPNINTDILVNVDRSSLVSVWDIPGSLQKLSEIQNKINNRIAISGFGQYGLYVSNQLQSTLSFYQINLTVMRLSFIVVSLPVFFVAWYMGTTVSDVSFNLRRREIGLLLTKGFSRRQLLRMFLTEALLIGLVGGAVGIALSFALNPLFVRAIGGEFTGAPVLGVDASAMTIVFSVAITVLAVFRPARRASNLATVDALREYMYVEEVKPYKKLWPWVAFILGTYKMIIFALGINILYEVMRLMSTGGNFLIAIFLGIWGSFDVYILTYIGPVLFFWGTTKIFIRGSLKFQEITARAAKFLGDWGTLASRNVQRNPARAAAVAFLIALIIGYGVQIIGTLASDQDYNVRLAYANVGADVSVTLNPPANATATMEVAKLIRKNVSDIASTTAEYSFYGESSFGGLQIKAVNTTEWLETAYYEDNWFSGTDIRTAFKRLSSNQNTIILSRDVAASNNLKVGDIISVIVSKPGTGASPYETMDLTIVGFFGNAQAQGQIFYQRSIGFATQGSYVSERLFQEFNDTLANSSSTRMLIKLSTGADGSQAAKKIRELTPRAQVYSVAESLQQQQTDFIATGTLSVQRLGVAFAVLATSVGTGLVTLVSLKERQREASIMGVRGLSFKQLTVMLLTENMAVVAFAVLLGTVAGLIIAYGNAVSFTATIPSLVTKRLVFPLDASLTVLSFFVLVFASTILPVLFMTKRYISRLERVVRQA